MRVAYVTAHYPFGPSEAFLGPEARELDRALDGGLIVIPTRPVDGVVHDHARELVTSTLAIGLASRPALRAFTRRTSSLPQTVARLGASRSTRMLCKNLAVAPKAAWLARALDRLDVEHVHVHWGGTSSTMAMLACEQAGIPWSLTLHRWDIAENNLLAEKVASATFVRTISRYGAAQLREYAPDAEPEILHMGVDVQVDSAPRATRPGRLRLLAVGSLTPQKGHADLLQAMRLTEAGATLDIVGEGPLRNLLAMQIRAGGLQPRVRLLGALAHSALLRGLRGGVWDVLVHPSLTGNGYDEGIPVVLMEAMAAGVPVIATPSGGVAELITLGAGLLLPATGAGALAEGIRQIAVDPARADALARGGIGRIGAEFDAVRIADRLVTRFDQAARRCV